MKKILIMFLLTFPILIFAIVTFTSTIIAYYVPIPVTSVSMVEGEDIMANALQQVYDLSFQINPEGSRNNSFQIYDDEGRLVMDYDDGTINPVIYPYPNQIFSLDVSTDDSYFIKKGLISLKVTIENYGFTRLTIVTKDGHYEAYSDIYVADPSLPPATIQGVVLDYTSIHDAYEFGTVGLVKVGYTYYPKQAFHHLSEAEQATINEQLLINAEALYDDHFVFHNIIKRGHEVFGNGRGELLIELQPNARIQTKNLAKNASYHFNVNQDGVNIYNYTELNKETNRTLGKSLYLLDHIMLEDFITFTNGTKIYGNGFKLDHSELPQYDERTEDGKLKYNGRYAIEFNGNNSGLYNTHVIGPLDENKQPFENIINVGFIAKNNTDRYMEAIGNIIENGRMNISLEGRAHTGIDIEDRATHFVLKDNQLIGAYLSSIEIDSYPPDQSLHKATHVEIEGLTISYTAIGIAIQNTRRGGGASELVLHSTPDKPAIRSLTWRNLDDASGALNMANFGYILRELKGDEYKDVYHQDGKNFYVNAVIMIRGGRLNLGKITFTGDETFERDLIAKIREPNFLEAMHPSIGGVHPFTIYLLNPEHYEGR